MNFFSRLFRKSAPDSSVSFDTMNHEMMARLNGAQSIAGRAVTESSAMTLSAAWACQRIISESVGMLPLGFFERMDDGSTEKANDHPLAPILASSPNSDMTSQEFREALGLSLCQAGNSYSMIDRNQRGAVISIYPMDSRNVVPVKTQSGEIKYRFTDRGRVEELPREKVWHVKGFGKSGLVGLSPLGAAREAIGFALASEEFGSRFFAQGGKPSGIAVIPNFLNPEQRKIARENLQQMLGGMSNAHKFALFEGGIKPEPWGEMPLQDLEFIALRKFNVQEVCRFYRVPPHMVGDLEKGASYASIEMMSMEFVMFTLMPYFTRIEASAARWLLPPAERLRYFARFNYEGLLRADSKGRSEFYASAVQNGWMTRNEVRAKENLNASDAEGMEGFTAQVNLSPIQKLGTQPPAPQRFSAPPSEGNKNLPAAY